MARVRRYQRLTLLLGFLAAAVAPSTIPAAYAEVAQVVAIAQRGTTRAPHPFTGVPAPSSRAIFRSSFESAPRAFAAHPAAPLYLLLCSLLR
jgi:hypothetical protein